MKNKFLDDIFESLSVFLSLTLHKGQNGDYVIVSVHSFLSPFIRLSILNILDAVTQQPLESLTPNQVIGIIVADKSEVMVLWLLDPSAAAPGSRHPALCGCCMSATTRQINTKSSFGTVLACRCAVLWSFGHGIFGQGNAATKAVKILPYPW